jgi:aryl-alcohol dehydrogenase-like predicted oxidoreductase
MQYRKFGNTDMLVSEIGFGSWAIGGNAMVGNTAIGWGKADDATSVKAIRAALDAGINFFDTADIYGLGHSEDLLGKELKGKNVIIATKVGNVARNEQFTIDYSKEYILKACDESLKRLQLDCIDYYQLHSARIQHLQNGACIEAMQQLQQQGKIRYWGISLNTFYPEAEAEFFMQNNLGNGFQLVFNIINQKALNLIKEAGKNGYGIIARMPLQFGLLTGKFNEQSTFSIDDHRHNRLNKEALHQFLEVLREYVWPVAENEGMNKTALALSFILSIKEISTVIPGIRTPEHVDQNTSGLKQLSEATMQQLLSLGENEMQPLMQLMERLG